MNKGVHIGGIQVVLLVPGCSRQYDVRVSAGRVEAEVDIHKQVQLACGALIMPFDQLIVVSVPTLLQYVVLRTQLASASGSAKEISIAPDLSFPITCLPMLASSVAPAFMASSTRSSGLAFHCGKPGNQPMRTA